MTKSIRLLEARLGRDVEIISMARDGWSTADQLEAFRREGLILLPDIVVVSAYNNDPQPILTEPSGQQTDWVIFRRLTLHLDIFRFLDYRLNRLGDLLGWRYSYDDWEQDLFDPNKPYFHRWEATVRELGKVLDDNRIDHYAFTMVSPVFPSSPETVRKYEIVAHTFAEAGFTTTNLQNDFVREFGPSGGRHLWALPNDAHPGLAINQFFAREMAKVLGPRVQFLLSQRKSPGNRKAPCLAET